MHILLLCVLYDLIVQTSTDFKEKKPEQIHILMLIPLKIYTENKYNLVNGATI